MASRFVLVNGVTYRRHEASILIQCLTGPPLPLDFDDDPMVDLLS